MKSYWLNFAVTDVERALNFYRNIGFEIIDERSNNGFIFTDLDGHYFNVMVM